MALRGAGTLGARARARARGARLPLSRSLSMSFVAPRCLGTRAASRGVVVSRRAPLASRHGDVSSLSLSRRLGVTVVVGAVEVEAFIGCCFARYLAGGARHAWRRADALHLGEGRPVAHVTHVCCFLTSIGQSNPLSSHVIMGKELGIETHSTRRKESERLLSNERQYD